MNRVNVKDLRLEIRKPGGCFLIVPKAQYLNDILSESVGYLEDAADYYFKDGMQEPGTWMGNYLFILFGEGKVIIPDPTTSFKMLDEDARKYHRYPGTSETADVMSAEDFVLLCNMMNYFQTFLSKQIKAGRGIWKGVTFGKTVVYNPWTGEFEDPIEEEEQS